MLYVMAGAAQGRATLRLGQRCTAVIVDNESHSVNTSSPAESRSSTGSQVQASKGDCEGGGTRSGGGARQGTGAFQGGSPITASGAQARMVGTPEAAATVPLRDRGVGAAPSAPRCFVSWASAGPPQPGEVDDELVARHAPSSVRCLAHSLSTLFSVRCSALLVFFSCDASLATRTAR